MTGNQLSDMTISATIPTGGFVPFVITSAEPGFSLTSNYIYDLGSDLLTRVSYTALAQSTAATLIGSTGPSNVQADIDARPTSAVLAASGGAGQIGFIQSGVGATARTVSAKVLESPASPEDFSGNDSVSLLAAATASTQIRLARGATYALPTLVDLSALNGRVIYMNGATIDADVGFTDTHLISISGDSQIIGPGTFNGTNVPAPAGAYSSGVYAGVGVYITGTGDDGVIDGVSFIEFQSGPILHDSATTRSGFKFRNCTFTDNQKYVANATNSIVAMHGVSNGLMADCQCTTYNWKAFYFANGSYNQIVRCHTSGGVVGHASHFLAGGNDNSIIDCTHTGVGFGVKVDDEARPSVINFKMNGGASAIYMQSCVDFEVIGGEAIDPTAKAMLIDAANGDCSGSVIGFRASRTTPGSTGDHVGIYIASAAAGVVSGLRISNCYLRNFLFGMQVANTGFAQTDIQIEDNELRNTGQYGILAYIGSSVVSGNLIEMDNASVEAAIHIERDSVTTTGNLEIANNVMRGCTADNIELLTRLHYESIRVVNNKSDGGTVFLNFNGNGNAADTVSMLEVTGNQGVGLTTGCSMTFNTTTSTRVKVEDNNFVNGSFVPVSNSFTNLTNVTSLVQIFSGTSTLAAGTVAVTFPIQIPSTSYRIALGGSAGESFSWASKATTGFTLNSSNGASTATVDWTISQIGT